MSYYPVMLNLKNRKVLFVGGGWETEHKVRGLLEAGANLTLLSPYQHPELDALEKDSKITWLRRGFEAGDLAGVWLVMSHTKDKADNVAIYAEAEARGVLCNSVDDPDRCSLILPSVVRRGDLIIGISTSGTAPALGVRIKQKLNLEYGEEYTEFLAILRSMRSSITAGFGSFDLRKKLWYDLMDSPALQLVKDGQPEAARAEIKRGVLAQREACQQTPCKGCTFENCAVFSGLEMVL
jgi:precorrin-2 dehydrogenase / sirohydrochlorin ferrochelatase